MHSFFERWCILNIYLTKIPSQQTDQFQYMATGNTAGCHGKCQSLQWTITINYITETNLFLAEINWCHSQTLPKSASICTQKNWHVKYKATVMLLYLLWHKYCVFMTVLLGTGLGLWLLTYSSRTTSIFQLNWPTILVIPHQVSGLQLQRLQ